MMTVAHIITRMYVRHQAGLESRQRWTTSIETQRTGEKQQEGAKRGKVKESNRKEGEKSKKRSAGVRAGKRIEEEKTREKGIRKRKEGSEKTEKKERRTGAILALPARLLCEPFFAATRRVASIAREGLYGLFFVDTVDGFCLSPWLADQALPLNVRVGAYRTHAFAQPGRDDAAPLDVPELHKEPAVRLVPLVFEEFATKLF